MDLLALHNLPEFSDVDFTSWVTDEGQEVDLKDLGLIQKFYAEYEIYILNARMEIHKAKILGGRSGFVNGKYYQAVFTDYKENKYYQWFLVGHDAFGSREDAQAMIDSLPD